MFRASSCYLICATPRSGSTLLCDVLSNTGIAGRPAEYFEALRHSGLPRRPREYFTGLDNAEVLDLLGEYSTVDTTPRLFASGEEYARYLDEVFAQGTTPNGVFAAKVMWGYLEDFVGNLRMVPAYGNLGVPELLAAVFPGLRYIYVTRQDKVRQAVSLWKAIQSSAWSHEGPRRARASREMVFHLAAVEHLVARMVAQEEAWDHYFTENGLQPCRVVYEELTASCEQTTRQVLGYLGIPVPEDFSITQSRMKRQADAVSEDWVQRYHALLGQGRGGPSNPPEPCPGG
jgi:LPS sulfotransferase NodH